MTEHTTEFYDGLAPLYHLIYPDWDTSITRQAVVLDSVIRETWGEPRGTILDVSCGIGTQALGLAKLGYQVTASDLSKPEITRAETEASKRGLNISFSVADMQKSFDHHARQFKIVISCDNSIPHLLTDDDIYKAFVEFYQCTLPDGGCIISVRDYAAEDLTNQQVRPYGTRNENGCRWLAMQVWEPHNQMVDVTMYLIQDHGEHGCNTKAFRTTYYAISINRLIELMRKAGYVDVRRIDNRFFQPLIIGTKKA